MDQQGPRPPRVDFEEDLIDQLHEVSRKRFPTEADKARTRAHAMDIVRSWPSAVADAVVVSEVPEPTDQ